MNIKSLIERLEELRQKHGDDLEVAVGYRDSGGAYYGHDAELTLAVYEDCEADVQSEDGSSIETKRFEKVLSL